MGDGFDFRPPQRRESRRFEPPPWEREAFDKLRREREDVSDESADAPVRQPEPAEPEPVAEGPGPDIPEAVDGGREADDPKMAGTAVDEGAVFEMLAGLAAEEPDTQRTFHTVVLGATAVLAAFGAVIMVWGVVALAGASRTGRVGVTGGSLFFLFGAASVGLAAWVAFKTLRQRGVL